MLIRALSLAMIAFSFFAPPQEARAYAYYEVGTSLSSFSNASDFFQQSQASSTNSGFIGSFGIFDSLTKETALARIDLGLQLRMSTASASPSGDALAMATFNAAMRVEFWRFFMGIGYSPVTWVSKPQSGLTSLHLNPNTYAYHWESGAIWRVIPEFQIIAVFGMEYGSINSMLSPAPVTEYGLHFRFPINPKEGPSSGAASYDGFRYPFGVMK